MSLSRLEDIMQAAVAARLFVLQSNRAARPAAGCSTTLPAGWPWPGSCLKV